MDDHVALRQSYRGGLAFLVVEIPLWIIATALAVDSPTSAFVAFFVGGILIAPLALAVQRFVIRRPVPGANPLVSLSTQLALVIPLCYPLVYLAVRADEDVVLAALGIVVGAHYLPFYFVYRLVGYAVASVVLVVGNSALALGLPGSVIAPGVFSSIVLTALAVHLHVTTRRTSPAR